MNGHRASSCPPPPRIFVAEPTAWTPHHKPVGWEPDDDGFGYVFATDDNSAVVLSVKGTSPRRKDNNLLFSCCCARINWSWTTVCDCYRSGWKCNQNCLEDALIEESLFYPIGTNLYNNITFMFPNANIWVIGHSLGGSLASLLGATFGVLVPSTHHITHVWHTADPIAMGTCNGVLSSCAIGGYAMESRCHFGNIIEYDTVSNLSWSVDVRTHAIAQMIEKVLSQPWAAAVELGREVPPLKRQDDCVDCYKWDFGNYSLL
ncbi:Alpha/Beta hydrolase protein [Russula brevipes]|nr:Alpha/Beta hydrolase protein [Russula brevipes]